MKSLVIYIAMLISTCCLLYISFSMHSFLFRLQSTQAVTPTEFRPVSLITQNSQPLEVVIVGIKDFPAEGMPVSIKSTTMNYMPIGPAIRYYDPSRGINVDVANGLPIPTYVVAPLKK